MAAQSARSLPRNPGIDLLRGVSIFLVLLNHIGLRIPLAKGVLASYLPTQLLSDLNFNGSEAVDLFFVISGFLIASHSIVRWGRLGTIHAREFYLRRAARILPLLLGLVAVLSLLHYAGVHGYVIQRSGQSLPGAVFSALGLHLNWYEAQTGYLPPNWDVLWSLSIEEIFYLGFPLACLLLRKDRIQAPLLVALPALQPWSLKSITNPIWREKAYLPGMSAIAVGVLAAMVAAHLQRPPRWMRQVLLIAGLCGVVGVLGFEKQLWHWLGWGTLLLLTVAGGGLVLAFHWKGLERPGWRIPGTGWMQSFGRLSYEIYLTHMFVVLAMLSVYYGRGAAPRYGVLWYIPAVAGSWALGWGVARFFSNPAERALRGRWLKPSDHSMKQEAPVAG
ncbi:MAG: acyltransferase family protein [Acidobacteriota bacterium]